GTFSRNPPERSSVAVTEKPNFKQCCATCEPMKPAAPVTRTFVLSFICMQIVLNAVPEQVTSCHRQSECEDGGNDSSTEEIPCILFRCIGCRDTSLGCHFFGPSYKKARGCMAEPLCRRLYPLIMQYRYNLMVER